MFCEVITQVFADGRPVNVELFLVEPVNNPLEPHIYAFEPFLVRNATVLALWTFMGVGGCR